MTPAQLAEWAEAIERFAEELAANAHLLAVQARQVLAGFTPAPGPTASWERHASPRPQGPQPR